MNVLKFKQFEIHTTRRQVRIGGEAVALGARAFDLLLLLVEQRERVVPKAEIFAAVWPGQVVEDNNLTVQISTLRRLLGPDVIATVTGRGYRFIAQSAEDVDGGAGPRAVRRAVGNLPLQALAVYGREPELAELLQAHAELPCITLCGLAGVGKTTLAVWAARQMVAARAYAHGAWQVELANVADPNQLVQAISAVLGLELDGRSDPLEQCLAQLRHRELLLLLDNCEHLTDAVAVFADAVIRSADRIHLLTTSLEPLRVPGERIVRLNPLAVPATPDASDATEYGAVRMLLERVRASMGGSFEPSAEELVDMIGICRQLDGVPLALEFAAARVAVLGLAGVRARLHDQLSLLSRGPRTAPSRHSSLQAALEWSHQLLPPQTQQVLHRLAVFPAGFSLPAAELLVGPEHASRLIEHLGVLVERSMLRLQAGQRERYRMLETTRAFALERLAATAADEDWQGRHAEVMAQVCALAARRRDSGWMWLEMPNARAALGWALGTTGHEQAAITIASHICVVLGAAGLTGEALEHLQRVLPLVDSSCPPMLAARFWHWYGRVGSEGRIPVTQSVQAMQMADAMFESMGQHRHRHACLRHLAEVELEAGLPEDAERHLRIARELELTDTSEADRMRRLRVEALLAAAQGQHELAFRHGQAALELADALGVKRYRLLLRADMAWTHLQMGQAEAAVDGCLDLLQYLDDGIHQGRARGRVLSGLTAALVAAGQVERALRSVNDSLLALQQANLLHAHCEVFAWLAASIGDVRAAAQLIGRGEAFAELTEYLRHPVARMARQRALVLIEASELAEADRLYWLAQGRSLSEAALVHLLERTFSTRLRQPATSSIGTTATAA